jgi:hypothetical protein
MSYRLTEAEGKHISTIEDFELSFERLPGDASSLPRTIVHMKDGDLLDISGELPRYKFQWDSADDKISKLHLIDELTGYEISTDGLNGQGIGWRYRISGIFEQGSRGDPDKKYLTSLKLIRINDGKEFRVRLDTFGATNFKSINVDGDTLLSGLLTAMSDVSFEKNVNISGVLTQEDTAHFISGVVVDKTLEVNGRTTLNNMLIANNGQYVSGVATFKNKITNFGGIDIYDGRVVAEGATFSEDVVVQNGLNVTEGIISDKLFSQEATISGAVISGLDVEESKIQSAEIGNAKITSFSADNSELDSVRISGLSVKNVANINAANFKAIKVSNGAHISGLNVTNKATIDKAEITSGLINRLYSDESSELLGTNTLSGINTISGYNYLLGSTEIQNAKIISGNADDMIITRERVTNAAINNAMIGNAGIAKETVGNSYITNNQNISGTATINKLDVVTDEEIKGNLDVVGNVKVGGNADIFSVTTDDIKDHAGNNIVKTDIGKLEIGSNKEQLSLVTDFNKDYAEYEPGYYSVKVKIGDRETILVTQEDISELNPSGIVDRTSNQVINGVKTFIQPIIANSGIYTLDLESLEVAEGEPPASGMVPHHLVTREVDPNENVVQAWLPNEYPQNQDINVSYSGISGQADLYDGLVPLYNQVRKAYYIAQDASGQVVSAENYRDLLNNEHNARIEDTKTKKGIFDVISGEIYIGDSSYSGLMYEASGILTREKAELDKINAEELVAARKGVEALEEPISNAKDKVIKAKEEVDEARDFAEVYSQQRVNVALDSFNKAVEEYNTGNTTLLDTNKAYEDSSGILDGYLENKNKIESELNVLYVTSGEIRTAISGFEDDIKKYTDGGFYDDDGNYVSGYEALKEISGETWGTWNTISGNYDTISGNLNEKIADYIISGEATTSALKVFSDLESEYNINYSKWLYQRVDSTGTFIEEDPNTDNLPPEPNVNDFLEIKDDPNGAYDEYKVVFEAEIDYIKKARISNKASRDIKDIEKNLSEEKTKLDNAEEDKNDAFTEVEKRKDLLGGLESQKTTEEGELTTKIAEITSAEEELKIAKETYENYEKNEYTSAKEAYEAALAAVGDETSSGLLQKYNEAKEELSAATEALENAIIALNAAEVTLAEAESILDQLNSDHAAAVRALKKVEDLITAQTGIVNTAQDAYEAASDTYSEKMAQMAADKNAWDVAIIEEAKALTALNDSKTALGTITSEYETLFDDLSAKFEAYEVAYDNYYNSYNGYHNDLLAILTAFDFRPYDLPLSFNSFMAPLNEPYKYKDFKIGIITNKILDPNFKRVVLVGNDYDELKLRSAPMGNGDKHIQATFDGENRVIANADDLIHLGFAEGTDNKLVGDIDTVSGTNGFELSMMKNTIVPGYSGMEIPEEPVIPPVETEKLFELTSSNGSIKISGLDDKQFDLSVSGIDYINNTIYGSGYLVSASFSGTDEGVEFNVEHTISGLSTYKFKYESTDDIDQKYLSDISGFIVTQELKNIYTQPDHGRTAIDFNGDNVTQQYRDLYKDIEITQTEYEKRMLASALDVKVLTEHEENERKAAVEKINRRLPEAPKTSTGRFSLIADVRTDGAALSTTYAWDASTTLPGPYDYDNGGSPLEYYDEAALQADPTKTNEYGLKLKILESIKKDKNGKEIWEQGKPVHETILIWAKLV